MSHQGLKYSVWLEAEEWAPGQWTPDDENSDVTVMFENGESWVATFISYRNVRSLTDMNRDTGDCLGGKYLAVTDMILVDVITRERIEEVVADLIREDALGAHFTRSRGGGRVTSFAPQFLVDDLERSIAFYRKIGFVFDEPWEGFYAIGRLDGLELHLKEGPKNPAERRFRRDHEHLDAAAGVDGIEAFYERCHANGVTIMKPLAATAWGTKDFYLEDPDGYIISFGGRPTAEPT